MTLPMSRNPAFCRSPPVVDFDVAIVGAGFGGLIAALELRRTGRESYLDAVTAAGDGGVVDVRASVQAAYNADLQEQFFVRVTGEVRARRDG